MKQNINIALTILLAGMLSASCAVNSDSFKAESYAESVSSVAPLSVRGALVGSKASESSYKFQWNLNDYIRVYNNGKSYFFSANEQAESSSFSVSGAASLSGESYAIYPKTVALENGKGTFSLAGQKGLFEDIDKYFLMTSAASASNNSVNFRFNEHIAVLAINVNFLYDNTFIQSIVLSGNGISSTLEINANGSEINVNALGSSEIVLDKPYVSNGYVFIAMMPTAGEFNVDVYDNANGHFFTTVDGKSLTSGYVNELQSNWDGGCAITFNPSVANWNNVNA